MTAAKVTVVGVAYLRPWWVAPPMPCSDCTASRGGCSAHKVSGSTGLQGEEWREGEETVRVRNIYIILRMCMLDKCSLLAHTVAPCIY